MVKLTQIKKDSFNLRLLGVSFSPKCLPFILVRSKITGIQKRPIIALTISIPLFKKLIFHVIRISPPTTATPIIDISKPMQAPIRDFMLSPSAKVEIKVKPKIASQKYSVGPNFKDTLAKGGANKAKQITPTVPPTKEDMQLIDIARSPLPFLAIGYPSKVVATAEGVPGVLTNNGQFQCSDGGPADPVCYTSPYPCGMVPDFVEDCEPCGNVQYNDAGEIIEGTGGDCIPITLDTAAEGYDKISKTKQLQFSYFRGIENASDNIAGLTLHTGSLSSSNNPYYYSVLNGKQNESKSDFIFNVSFGHYAGSGSYTGGDGHKGASEVVYKQYASLLLDDINIDSGFRITSGSDVIPSGETSKKDEFIYVINFERKKFEERILESFTLEFSGSNGLNNGKNIKLTTNLSSLRESQYGSRYDIISGSAGVPHNGHTQIAGRYGHLYSDQGVIILGEKIAHEMSGSGITIGDAIIGSDSNSSHQLYPKLTNTSDSRNALRLFNCLNNVNGNCITGLRGEKEVTDVTYICRLAADDFNFTNNFSIITGSGRNMFQEDTAVMNGFPTSITSSAFTSSGEPSSLIYEGGPGVTGDGTLQTQTILEDGSPFIWPGGNVSTMHGNSHTFITGIELYDEHGEMLAVARPSTPIKKAFDREMVIKIKLTY